MKPADTTSKNIPETWHEPRGCFFTRAVYLGYLCMYAYMLQGAI